MSHNYNGQSLCAVVESNSVSLFKYSTITCTLLKYFHFMLIVLHYIYLTAIVTSYFSDLTQKTYND